MITNIEWIPFDPVNGPLPEEHRYVLLQLDEHEGAAMPPAVVVGYLRFAAGRRDSPKFIHPGAGGNALRTITHWADCLGDDFSAPLWPGKQRPRKPAGGI